MSGIGTAGTTFTAFNATGPNLNTTYPNPCGTNNDVIDVSLDGIYYVSFTVNFKFQTDTLTSQIAVMRNGGITDIRSRNHVTESGSGFFLSGGGFLALNANDRINLRIYLSSTRTLEIYSACLNVIRVG